MILYIHGFRTTHDSYIATLLKGYFGDTLISSNHSHKPQTAIEQLEKIIQKEDIQAVIASSLGGYYATYLSTKYNLKTVLINPSVEPHITTREYLGTIEKHDGTTFEWKEKHLYELSKLWVENLKYENFYVFLKRGDEILDYNVAKERYKNSKLLIEDDGDHRFSDLEIQLDKVKAFLKR